MESCHKTGSRTVKPQLSHLSPDCKLHGPLISFPMSSANGRPLPPPAPSKRSTQAEGTEGRSTGVRPRSESDAGSDGAAASDDAAASDGKGSSSAAAALGGSALKAPGIATSPVISEAATASIPLAEGIRNNSIAPESLRKPYASLAPQPKKSRSTTSPSRSPTGPRPQLESFPGLEDELTGAGQTNAGQANSGQISSGQTSPGQAIPGAITPGQTSSIQPSPSTKSTRAICKKHRIARDKNGVCMLCRKEEATQASGLGWKLMVAFILLSVIVSAAIAAYVKLKQV